MMEGERKLQALAVLLLVSSLALPKGAEADDPCPGGHIYSSDITQSFQCLYLVHEALSWDDAVSRCDSLYGGTPVVWNNRMLKSAIQREEGGDGDYWIYLTDKDGEGVYKWEEDSINSDEIKGTHWADEEPNNANGNEHCVHISASRNYHWNDRDCDKPTEFSCSAGLVNDGTIECPSGWEIMSYSEGRCFKVFDGETDKLGWDDAQAACQLESANLAAITSDLVNRLFFGDNQMANKLGIHDSYWIALNDKETEGEYRWLDASTQTAFTFWKTHEPSDADNDEDCVRIQGDSNFRWNDAQCDLPSYYICEQPATVDPGN